VTELATDSLIKLYYNITLMIKVKEEIYDDIVLQNEDMSEADFKLIESDLNQLAECKKSLKEVISKKIKEKDVEEEIDRFIMLDPYSLLINRSKNVILSEDDRLNGLFNFTDKKQYIN